MVFFVVLLSVITAASASTSALAPFPGAPTHQNDRQCHHQEPIVSCSASPVSDTCCSPTPGGLILQTQFWDTNTGLEAQGQLLPDNITWTIHGLWPDFCNGSFTQYCDITRQFDPSPFPPTASDGSHLGPYTGPGVDTFIRAFGRLDLLDFMNTFWISQGSPNAAFWAHEFSKHATCFSTWDVKCYQPYYEHMEVVDYFQTVTHVYKRFPTGRFLASHGILPSNTTTYSLAAIQGALKAHTGAIPFLGCSGPSAPQRDGRTILNEVWYFNHVLGTPQKGEYIHIDSVTRSTCTATGEIKYFERNAGSIRAAKEQE